MSNDSKGFLAIAGIAAIAYFLLRKKNAADTATSAAVTTPVAANTGGGNVPGKRPGRWHQ